VKTATCELLSTLHGISRPEFLLVIEPWCSLSALDGLENCPALSYLDASQNQVISSGLLITPSKAMIPNLTLADNHRV
jgi:Leucine-rich repeat (LRR) protein